MNKLQEIFREKAVNYLVCFNNHCPLHERCLRYDVGQAADPQLRAVSAVHPNYEHAKDGQCDLFRDHTPQRMNVGMKQHFYTDMPAHMAVAIKKRLIALNSRATYYQYHNGRRPITPQMQQYIEQVCREEGWQGPLVFDGETEDYVW